MRYLEAGGRSPLRGTGSFAFRLRESDETFLCPRFHRLHLDTKVMVELLLVLVVLLTAACIALAKNVMRIKRDKRISGLGKPWAIKRVRVEEFESAFRPGPLGPTTEAEVHFIGKFLVGGVPGGTSDFEAWILAVLAKRARLAFEFGTATGKTTYLLARNVPAGGRVVTITLDPEQAKSYAEAPGDSPVAANWARNESAFTTFLYTGTEAEKQVTQLFGNSKSFDETPYKGRCDLIFVDGSHAYSYVVSDSRKALSMLAPGGVVLWHDYSGPRRAADVYRALNELSAELPLVHLHGTSLVAYRRPEAG